MPRHRRRAAPPPRRAPGADQPVVDGGREAAHVDAERLAGVPLRVEVGDQDPQAARAASRAATFTHSVVLQVPPFSLMKAMRRMANCRLQASGFRLQARALAASFGASPEA